MSLPSMSSGPGCQDYSQGERGAARGVKQSSEGPEGILKEIGRAEDALDPSGVLPIGWPGGVLWVDEGLTVSSGQEAPHMATRPGPGKTAPEMKQRIHEAQMKGPQRTRATAPKTEKHRRKCDR